MQSNKDKIKEAFYKVKNLGFVQSNRKNNTGIGKTFEDYIGVVENNIDRPDLFGYEIKSHRSDASSYITLFTKAPNFPPQANAYLKNQYGIPYAGNLELKKLHTSLFADRYNNFNNKYSFRLLNERKEGKLRIAVYENETKCLIDDTVGYNYEMVDSILHQKLKNLFYVSAERKCQNAIEYFYFNHAEIFSVPSLSKFLSLLDEGLIMFDIRIGSYKSGKYYGKPHDHGSGFRIRESNLHLLYEEKEEII